MYTEKEVIKCDTKTLVEFIGKAMRGDKTLLKQIGINETDAKTYLRVYPQFAPK